MLVYADPSRLHDGQPTRFNPNEDSPGIRIVSVKAAWYEETEKLDKSRSSCETVAAVKGLLKFTGHLEKVAEIKAHMPVAFQRIDGECCSTVWPKKIILF